MYTKEELAAVLEADEEFETQQEAATSLGLTRRSYQRRLYEARKDGSILYRDAQTTGFNPENVSGYWIKTDDGSYYVKNDNGIDYDQMRDAFLKEAKDYSPTYANDESRFVPGDYLLIIDPADTHFGKRSSPDETGYSYDLEETTRRFREGVTELLEKSRSFGIDRIVFVLGNDVLHVDTTDNKTTGGTPQDTSGSIWQMFQVAKKSYIAAIEELARVAPVHLVHVPSNHDWKSGWMLSDSICSWFRNHPNVIAADGSQTIAHRKYIQYGLNLNMFTHGDGAKEAELSQLMQYEARAAWGKSKYATVYTHHTHHKHRKTYGKQKGMIEKDHTGVTVIHSRDIQPDNNVFVETVRSISAPDGWHHRNGYVNEQAMECFLQHVERGPEVRFTHYF